MTSLTLTEAQDEMLTMFKNGWDGTELSAFYDEVSADRANDLSAFVKVYWNVEESKQVGFGGVGNRMFRRNGTLRFELHTLAEKGLSESNSLVTVILNSFEGKHSPGGVWFSSTNVADMGRNGTFHVVDIAVFFSFDEIK